jgi:hypothetical protein
MNNVIHPPAFEREVIANGRRRGNYPRNVTRMDAYIRRHAYAKEVQIEDLDRERIAVLEARAYLEKGPLGDALRNMREIMEGYMRLSYAACGREREIRDQIVSELVRTEADRVAEAELLK